MPKKLRFGGEDLVPLRAGETLANGYSLDNGVFCWTGPSYLTADRMLAAASDETSSTLAEAADFLRKVLHK